MRVMIALFISLGAAMSLTANAGPYMPKHPLYCEFWIGNQALTLPDAYMMFDPSTMTVYTRSGYPRVTKPYQVIPNYGIPPYYNHGVTLTISTATDVPVLSISDKPGDTIPFLAYALDNHEATWGKIPGFPSTLNAGLCFAHPLFPQDFMGW